MNEYTYQCKKIIEDGESYTVIYKDNGSVLWYKYRTTILHRKNGPAVITDDSEKWYLDGKLHRMNGPAIKNDYFERWYFNGKLHRETGPAKLDIDGSKNYYVHGKFVDVSTDEELMIKLLLE